MKTFSIQTLGCKVNQYESEQIATLLRSRGLRQVENLALADLRIVNTCSVTAEADSKSRQLVRRATRLPVLENHQSARPPAVNLVTGCWATSHHREAETLPGVTAVITHQDDVARRIDQLLGRSSQGPVGNERSMIEAGTPVLLQGDSKPQDRRPVKEKTGTRSLPLLSDRHTGHQRAFVKIQDGCDAHCTYCIIPQLRPALWSKPIDDAVEEVRRLVEAGHREIVLTGIFLSAYGQATALRRRQPDSTGSHLIRLIDALCSRVTGLRRVRFSSLEPGDLKSQVISNLRTHAQVVPHFHLPLQSGSDRTLRRMNRQYTRGDYLRMLETVYESFDRPAITTDIITGFPGESDDDFQQTLDVVDRARFIHVHAFPYSPRPGTAAARWSDRSVPAHVSRRRIQQLSDRAAGFDLAFRRQFIGSEVEILVEHTDDPAVQHGRCERYFDVHVEHDHILTGRAVRVRIDRVTTTRTHGSVVSIEGNER